MLRVTATTGKWLGAFSAWLALPFFSGMALADMPVDRSWEDASTASSLPTMPVPSRWRDYALSSITPKFSWSEPARPRAVPSVLDSYATISDARFEFANGEASTIGVSLHTGVVDEMPGSQPGGSSRLMDASDVHLQRTVVSPSLSRRWGNDGELRLTGVLAYQRFATPNLGLSSGMHLSLPGWLGDSSYGVGARVDVSERLGERLRWRFGFQSRVDMDAFDQYRGVFSDRADFDIPASTSFGLSYELTPRVTVDAAIERIDYSAIRPFTSSNFPRAFLALLGDSSSPVFAWRDLDVYSIGWMLEDERIGNLQMRYTTRQQPIPTSRLLADALDSATADNLVTLGWSRPFGSGSRFSFNASYATSPYYLLMPSYVSRPDAKAGRVEVEALWSSRF